MDPEEDGKRDKKTGLHITPESSPPVVRRSIDDEPLPFDYSIPIASSSHSPNPDSSQTSSSDLFYATVVSDLNSSPDYSFMNSEDDSNSKAASFLPSTLQPARLPRPPQYHPPESIPTKPRPSSHSSPREIEEAALKDIEHICLREPDSTLASFISKVFDTSSVIATLKLLDIDNSCRDFLSYYQPWEALENALEIYHSLEPHLTSMKTVHSLRLSALLVEKGVNLIKTTIWNTFGFERRIELKRAKAIWEVIQLLVDYSSSFKRWKLCKILEPYRNVWERALLDEMIITCSLIPSRFTSLCNSEHTQELYDGSNILTPLPPDHVAQFEPPSQFPGQPQTLTANRYAELVEKVSILRDLGLTTPSNNPALLLRIDLISLLSITEKSLQKILDYFDRELRKVHQTKDRWTVGHLPDSPLTFDVLCENTRLISGLATIPSVSTFLDQKSPIFFSGEFDDPSVFRYDFRLPTKLEQWFVSKMTNITCLAPLDDLQRVYTLHVLTRLDQLYPDRFRYKSSLEEMINKYEAIFQGVAAIDDIGLIENSFSALLDLLEVLHISQTSNQYRLQSLKKAMLENLNFTATKIESLIKGSFQNQTANLIGVLNRMACLDGILSGVTSSDKFEFLRLFPTLHGALVENCNTILEKAAGSINSFFNKKFAEMNERLQDCDYGASQEIFSEVEMLLPLAQQSTASRFFTLRTIKSYEDAFLESITDLFANVHLFKKYRFTPREIYQKLAQTRRKFNGENVEDCYLRLLVRRELYNRVWSMNEENPFFHVYYVTIFDPIKPLIDQLILAREPIGACLPSLVLSTEHQEVWFVKDPQQSSALRLDIASSRQLFDIQHTISSISLQDLAFIMNEREKNLHQIMRQAYSHQEVGYLPEALEKLINSALKLSIDRLHHYPPPILAGWKSTPIERFDLPIRLLHRPAFPFIHSLLSFIKSLWPASVRQREIQNSISGSSRHPLSHNSKGHLYRHFQRAMYLTAGAAASKHGRLAKSIVFVMLGIPAIPLKTTSPPLYLTDRPQ